MGGGSESERYEEAKRHEGKLVQEASSAIILDSSDVIVAADCSATMPALTATDINSMIALEVAHPRGAMWVNGPAGLNGPANMAQLVFGAYRADLYGNPDKWNTDVLLYWRNRGVPICFIPSLAISGSTSPTTIAVTSAYQSTKDAAGNAGTLRWCDIAGSGFNFGSAHTDAQNTSNNTTFKAGCNNALPGGFACVESVCGPYRLEGGTSAGDYYVHEGVQGIYNQVYGTTGTNGILYDVPWMVQCLTWDDYHDGNAMQSDASQQLLMSFSESPNFIRGSALPAMTTITGAMAGSTGSLSAGTYGYQITYTGPGGEGKPVATAGSVVVGGCATDSFTVTAPAMGSQSGASGWTLYVETSGGSTFYQQASATALGTNVTVNTAASSGLVAPFVGTNGITYSSLPHGGYAAVLPYFSQWYQTGLQPPIYRDRIFYAYRGCAWGQIQTGKTIPDFGPSSFWHNQPSGGSPPDDVYATVFLTPHDAAQMPTLTITPGAGTPYTLTLTNQITNASTSFGSNTGSVVLGVSGTGISLSVTGPVILFARSDAEEYCGVSP